MGATAVSKIQLDNALKNSLYSFLHNVVPYCEILLELSAGTRQAVKNNLIFKQMSYLLVVHDKNEDADVDFWRIVSLTISK